MNTRSPSTPLNSLSPFSIGGKFIWMTAVITICASFVLFHQFKHHLQHFNEQQLNSIGQTASSQLALSSSSSVLSNDILSLNVSTKQLVADPLIDGAEVASKNGEKLAQSGRPTELIYSAEILSNQEKIGEVQVFLDESAVELQQSKYQQKFALLLVGICIVLISLTWMLGRSLSRALESIRQTASELQHQDTITPLDATRRDEFGEINRLLNARFAPAIEPETEQPDTAPFDNTESESAEDLNFNLENSQDHRLAETPAEEIQQWDISQDSGPLQASGPDSIADNPALPDCYLLYINHHSSRSDYLSEDEREALLAIYRNFFQQACELYKGETKQDDDGNWYALFQPLSDNQSHGINALCAAQLFKGMYRATNQQRIGTMQPVLNLKICLLRDSDAALEKAKALSAGVESNELISHQPLFDIEELRERLLKEGQYKKVGDDCYLLSSLCCDFQQLIDRQVQHFIGS